MGRDKISPFIELKNDYPHLLCDTLPVDPCYTNIKYNRKRNIKLMMFSDVLFKNKEYKSLMREYRLNIIFKIERGCYNEAIRKCEELNVIRIWGNKIFEDLYHIICYRIICLIDSRLTESFSKELLMKIINGSVNLEMLAYYSNKELCPDKYQHIIDIINMRSNIKTNERYSKLYFCIKCRSYKTKSKKIQNRCNDESSGVEIECINCGRQWYA